MSREQLTELSVPFSGKLVKKAPQGKYGSYVAHSTVNERLLSIVGPFDMRVTDTFMGEDGKLEAVILELTLTVDGRVVTIQEAGECERPTNWNTQGARLKDAISDGVKRCAMRAGLGLHLWSQDDYFLHSQLLKDYGDESRPSLPGASAAVGGAEDSVQLHSEPPPAAPLTDDTPLSEIYGAAIGKIKVVDDQGIKVTLTDIIEDAEQRGADNVVELHPEDDEAWAELLNILSEKPDDGTMGIIQDRCRRLYTFMATTGLWTEGARVAALKQHYDTTHLTNLQRASLVEFAKHSFDAAKAKVTEEPDHG